MQLVSAFKLNEQKLEVKHCRMAQVMTYPIRLVTCVRCGVLCVVMASVRDVLVLLMMFLTGHICSDVTQKAVSCVSCIIL